MKPTALWWLAGFLSTGHVDLTCDGGTIRTPSVGAEFSATPATPKPWSSSTWVNAPPAEWPMMIGSESSALIAFSKFSTIAGTRASTIGVSSSFSASTSTSKPG